MTKTAFAYSVALALACTVMPARAVLAADAVQTAGDRMLMLTQGLTGIAALYKTDCAAMGDALGRYVDADAQPIADVKQLTSQMTDEQREAYGNTYGARLTTAFTALEGGLSGCAGNAAVAAAMKKFKN